MSEYVFRQHQTTHLIIPVDVVLSRYEAAVWTANVRGLAGVSAMGTGSERGVTSRVLAQLATRIKTDRDALERFKVSMTDPDRDDELIKFISRRQQ